MEILQISNQTLSTYSTQKKINANDVNPTNANSDEMCALNLKENSKASFEDTVLKVAISEAKSRVKNEYRVTVSKDTKLDIKALLSDIIEQSNSK